MLFFTGKVTFACHSFRDQQFSAEIDEVLSKDNYEKY